MQQQLLNLLSARQGHFRYESGYHGDLWLDLDLLFLRPRRVQPFAVELAHQLAHHNIAAVCGPLIGGAPGAPPITTPPDTEYFYTPPPLPPHTHPIDPRGD